MPPTIIEDVFPTSVICEKQTPCLLSCYATSDTPVNYSWTKVGQGSLSDDVKFMNKSIVVTPRGAQDYGVYVCNATNSFGTASNEITLIEGRKLSAGVAMNKRGDSEYIFYVFLFFCLHFNAMVRQRCRCITLT